MRNNFIILLLSLTALPSLAQMPELEPLSPEMKENASSIIRLDRTQVECASPTRARISYTRVVTILDKSGLDEADFVAYCDKFTQLKKFRAEAFSSTDKSLRKYKKSDLVRTEYSSHFATDNYYYILSAPQGFSYPFTMVFEWELEQKDNLAFFPSMNAFTSYDQSVQQCSYTLTAPQSMTIDCRAVNSFEPQTTLTTDEKKQTRTIHLSYPAIKAKEKEPYSPSFFESDLRRVLIRPQEFDFDGYPGRQRTWKEFGDWQLTLLAGRQQLPQEIKDKVHQLTDSLGSDRDKVRALYEYMGSMTRYVSIQLGIGGWQPMPASEVAATGFGDCKALSNFLHSLLAEVGIPSNYTVIRMGGSKSLLKDFACIGQMNHVILQVPLPGDTLWLECTNTMVPFGYVHEGIAGHDALVISSQGSHITALPSYPDSLNTDSYRAQVELQADGQARMTVSCRYGIDSYDSVYGLARLSPLKQKNFVSRDLSSSKVQVNSVTFTDVKNPVPEFSYNAEVDMSYANISGNRVFVPANVCRQAFRKLNSRRQRKSDIAVRQGYQQIDTIDIRWPEVFTFESRPQEKALDTEFGSFSAVIDVAEDRKSARIIHTLKMNQGIYPVGKYKDFCEFLEAVSKSYSSTFVLKK